MSANVFKARCCGEFDDDRHNSGPLKEAGDEIQTPRRCHSTTEEERRRKHQARRRREEMFCRYEFARLFGADAERTSRGGVTWLS